MEQRIRRNCCRYTAGSLQAFGKVWCEMLIDRLKLNYFGRFHNKEIELKPGINLIYGDNEAGKSTIHTFIRGMLFGIERMRGRGAASKEDIYTRYLPWDYPGAYGGSMDIRIGEKQYRLQRSFHASDKYFTITDLSSGREVKLKEGHISELIPGLTESAFKNTISIEQLKAQTDAELASQVRNYIANLSIAKSKEVDVAKAISLLNEKRKQLEASMNPAALQALQAEVEEGLDREERMDQLTLQLKELQGMEQELRSRMEAAAAFINEEDAARMEQLPAILEKFRSYQEKSQQLNILETQEKELRKALEAGKKERISADALKEDIRKAQQLRNEKQETDRKKELLQEDKEQSIKPAKRDAILCLVPAAVAALIIMLLTGFRASGILAALAVILLGLAGYICFNRAGSKKRLGFAIREEELTRQQEEIQERLAYILQKYHAAGLEELALKQEEVLSRHYELENARKNLMELEPRRRETEDIRDVLYETIMKYMQHFIREEELTEAAMQRLKEVIRQRRQEAKDRLSALSGQYEECKKRLERIKWEIEGLEGNEQELLKNQERLTALQQDQKANAIEMEAVKLALTTIQELSADIHDSFGQQLNRAVSEVIADVTDGRYKDLKIDEKLDVKVGCNGEYVPLDRLSAGTIDQVYFALRLAVADLLLGPDEVPLLLDDSFALYDESRVKAALSRISRRKQILLFTCHKREQAILNELGLSYHMVDLS